MASWPAREAPVYRMVILDRRGVLAGLPPVPLPPPAAVLCGRFANQLVLAHKVAERGELLRAAESDLEPAGLAELRRTVAAAADPVAVPAAVAAAWALGRSLWVRLAAQHGFTPPDALFADLDAVLGAAGGERRHGTDVG